MRIITLVSDFGLEDGYVAAMKGVIASIAPEARLVDVTHLVPPQDVAFARFRLLTVAPFFPVGTVHLAVVDPGVGTARRAVGIQSRSGSFFVGPDNGILLGALETDPPMAAVELREPGFWRTPGPSATFHGPRHLCPGRGAPGQRCGPGLWGRASLVELVKLELPGVLEMIPSGAQGAVQAVDRFGKLISNVSGALLANHGAWSASVAGRTVTGHRTYADVPPNEVLALVGGHGFVEIAVHRGDARRALGVRFGDRVQILWA